jgi:hypothetical protein
MFTPLCPAVPRSSGRWYRGSSGRSYWGLPREIPKDSATYFTGAVQKNKNETRKFNPVPLFQDLMPIRTTKSQIKAVLRYNINSQSSIQTFMIKQPASSNQHQATSIKQPASSNQHQATSIKQLKSKCQYFTIVPKFL